MAENTVLLLISCLALVFLPCSICFHIGHNPSVVRGSRGFTKIHAVVALTREVGNNDKLRKLLEKESFDIVEIPCVAQKRCEGAESLPSLIVSKQFDYITITSPASARLLMESMQKASEVDPEATADAKQRVVSIGKGTSDVLRKQGVEPCFEPSRAHAEDLAAELPRSGEEPVKVLYPASELAASVLEDGLRGRGFQVTRLDTYTTAPAQWTEEDYSRSKGVDIVTFGSPSTVRVWTERVGNWQQAACIGKTSADACHKGNWQHVYFPDSPGMKGWVEAVREASNSPNLSVQSS